MTPKNMIRLNSRHIVLFTFYMIMFLFSFYPKKKVFSSEFSGGYSCYMYSFFEGWFIVVMISFIFFYFLPIFYWLFILATVFSKSFGGARDPLIRSLGEAEIYHLKFIKCATLLKFLEQFFLHIVATHDLHMSKGSYAITRIIGLVIMLLANVLFMYYENMFAQLRRKIMGLFSNRNVNYRVFRNRGVYEETVDYRNLVETA